MWAWMSIAPRDISGRKNFRMDLQPDRSAAAGAIKEDCTKRLREIISLSQQKTRRFILIETLPIYAKKGCNSLSTWNCNFATLLHKN
jgi:hypothetical protein